MNAEKRLQVNVRISDVLLLYPNINVTYFPVAWFEEVGNDYINNFL